MTPVGLDDAPVFTPAPRNSRMSDSDSCGITVSHPPSPGGVDVPPSSPSSIGSFDTSEVPSSLHPNDGVPAKRTRLCDEHIQFLVRLIHRFVMNVATDQTVQVDGTHFTVHESIIDPISEKTMQILAGMVDGIVALEDVTVVDFKRFLSAMRCKCVVRHLSLEALLILC
jgi:hypothetical protein